MALGSEEDLPLIRFNVISHAAVQAAIDEAREKGLNDQTDKYNTHAHKKDDICSKVPERNGLRHVYPDRTASHFSNWLDVIATSQGFHQVHMLQLPNLLTTGIIATYKIWALKTDSSLEVTTDYLTDYLPKHTAAAISLEEVFFPGSQYFLRLDACSTKDSVHGTKPVITIAAMLESLYTSTRAFTALQDHNDRNSTELAKIFLLPYRPDMDTSREFRVFCPPVPAPSIWSKQIAPLKTRITAISQYKWHAPHRYSYIYLARKEAKLVSRVADEILARIVKHTESLSDQSLFHRLRAEGFVFDIFLTPGNAVQLIELNPFGALSGCGSCLFHWIEDAEVLCGAHKEVEVRVAM